jgi:hypothetical protein
MTTPDDDTDVYGWTQAQAALIRARAWEALDVEHAAEEIEDLCKTDAHHLTMLDYSLEESPRVRPVLERRLPKAYRWARERVMRRRTPPPREPLAECPWPLAGLLDERWWPREAQARLP